MQTYKVTAPDGTVITRKTAKTYSHAILLQGSSIHYEGRWFASFASRLDLALATVDKEKASNQDGVKHWDQVILVELAS